MCLTKILLLECKLINIIADLDSDIGSVTSSTAAGVYILLFFIN
jgi:hypothetical protein